MAKLTKTQRAKRVETAKDVLKWIASKRIKAVSENGYIEPTVPGIDIDDIELSFKNNLGEIATKEYPCEVCARGAMLIAHVDKYNNCLLSEAKAQADGYGKGTINDIFDHDTLNAIERCFEQAGHGPESLYGESEEDDTKRLKMIMNNIIKNDGEFIVPAKYTNFDVEEPKW